VIAATGLGLLAIALVLHVSRQWLNGGIWGLHHHWSHHARNLVGALGLACIGYSAAVMCVRWLP
jgi:hypothetical protein